jgi:hypothetical protein
MMNRFFFLLITFLMLSVGGYSQRKNSYGQAINMYKADRLILSFNYLQWQNLPVQVSLQGVNRGFYMGMFFDNPLGGTRLSIAYGVSITTNNLFSDAIPASMLDSACMGTQFIKIDDICSHSVDYTQNKMVFSYLSLPIELRLRLGKEENVKISAGFEIGYLTSSFVKYKGDNIFLKSSDDIKIKYYNIKHASQWRYGVSGRIGFNRFGIRIFYPLVNTFNENSTQNLFPIELGLSLMVF